MRLTTVALAALLTTTSAYAERSMLCDVNPNALLRKVGPERYAELCPPGTKPAGPQDPFVAEANSSALCAPDLYAKYTPEERAVVDGHCRKFAEANDPTLKTVIDPRCDPTVAQMLPVEQRQGIICTPVRIKDLPAVCQDYLLGRIWFGEDLRERYCPQVPPVRETTTPLVIMRRQ